MVNKNGFTLLEIMIVVVIIGILAAIAYPSYTQHIIKSNRVDVQSEMVRIASLMQRYKVLNSSFLKSSGQPVTLDDLNVPEAFPNTDKSLYELSLSNVTAGTWTLKATPTPATLQADNGAVIMNNNGEKCWTKGASNCTVSSTSNWDGK